MRKIKTAALISIICTTGLLPAATAMAANNSTAEILADEYLKGDSNVASITGSILGGALTAHPAGAVVGSVGGYLISKLTQMLTHDENEKTQTELKIKPEQPQYRQSSPSQMVYFQRPSVPGYFSSPRSQQYRQNYRVAYSSAHSNTNYTATSQQGMPQPQLTTRIANRSVYYSNMYSRPARTVTQNKSAAQPGAENKHAEQIRASTVQKTPSGLSLIRVDQ